MAAADSPVAGAVRAAAAVVRGSVANLAGRRRGSRNSCILNQFTRRAKEELYGHEIAYDF